VATISIDGTRIKLIDTAGVDAELDLNATTIDATAQVIAVEFRERALVRAYCLEATGLTADVVVPDCDIVVATKSDLTAVATAGLEKLRGLPVVVTSSRTGEGLARFGEEVQKLLASSDAPRRGAVEATAERCGESVRLAADALSRATDLVKSHAGDELAAAELRVALDELGRIVGAVYTDDLLDRIFKTFCIGK
jgi:tRNA modification GTPase